MGRVETVLIHQLAKVFPNFLVQVAYFLLNLSFLSIGAFNQTIVDAADAESLLKRNIIGVDEVKPHMFKRAI